MGNPDEIPVEARDIPSKLLGDVQISLEEGLFVRAIDSLSAVTFQGLSRPKLKGEPKANPNGTQKQKREDAKDAKDDKGAIAAVASDNNHQPRRLIYIPPPEYLAIITTLSIHPEMTSKKCSKTEHPEVGERARKYISNLVRMVGPNAARLQDAWKFRAASTPTRTAARKSRNEGRRRLRDRSVSPDDDGPGAGRKKSAFGDTFEPFAFLAVANEESAFAHCEDGWALVGWAFVCSVEYPRRWVHYSRFLKMVLDALHADWKGRNEVAKKGHRSEAKVHECLAQAMGFLPKQSQAYGSGFYKKVARAIFADGSELAMKEFLPAFNYEITKRPKTGKAFNMFKNLDPEHPTGLKSNYDGGSSSQSQEIKEIEDDGGHSDSDVDELPRSKQAAIKSSDESRSRPDSAGSTGDTIMVTDPNYVEGYDLTLDWGGMDSIVLRQNFMCLMCHMHQYDQSTLEILYDEFSYTIGHLELDEMLLFVSTVPPCSELLTFRFRSSLWQYILCPLIGQQQQVDSEYFGDLSDDKFIKVYLPAAATKSDVEVNARVAVLVEALARLWMTYSEGKSSFLWSERLEKAVESGIMAREKKVEEKGGMKKKNAGELYRVMELSHVRLRMLLRLSKAAAETSQ